MADITQTKALSIRQPWAWLICAGHKPWENRTWKTNYRGQLLIHAGLKVDKDGYTFAKSMGIDVPDDLATGAIVGAANMIGILDHTAHPVDNPWAFGPYCWRMHDATHMDPIPCKGRLGLFTVEGVQV